MGATHTADATACATATAGAKGGLQSAEPMRYELAVGSLCGERRADGGARLLEEAFELRQKARQVRARFELVECRRQGGVELPRGKVVAAVVEVAACAEQQLL